MTSKKHRLAIEESLSSALEPPRKRQPSPALNEILSQYATTQASAETETPPPDGRTPPTPRTAGTPPTSSTAASASKKILPVAPERDFTRVPNSVVRDVVAGGYFTGKSKQLYDYLYQRTRGAVVPVRSLKISKPTLMKGCGIGSERTLLKNLEHLKVLGLVRVTYTDGKHEGNSYEVFMPEEAGLPTLRTPPTPPTPPTEGTARHARAEVPPVPPVESGVRDVGSNSVESITSDAPKTLYKTNTERSDDDEAFADFAASFRQLAKEITGRELTSAERHKWKELADVLAAELRIAAARTTVSSVPAFLAEHLRRRLWKLDKRQARAEGRELPDESVNTPSTEDAAGCPDCEGSGWWYPEGQDKGVAKCRHANLVPPGAGK